MDKRINRIVARHLKQAQEMNLLTNYDDTLLAMAEIEGEGWLDQQLRVTEDTQLSVPNMLKHIRKKHEDLAEHEKDLETETDPEEIESIKHYLDIFGDLEDSVGDTIYGSGGWNRYIVKGTGEVLFSRLHSGTEDIEKAKELGFKIF